MWISDTDDASDTENPAKTMRVGLGRIFDGVAPQKLPAPEDLRKLFLRNEMNPLPREKTPKIDTTRHIARHIARERYVNNSWTRRGLGLDAAFGVVDGQRAKGPKGRWNIRESVTCFFEM
ncbi:uncharacterized protein GIQ15_03632 [Arthroderma uncinatum]|uniref:uncharacterized protein n=1 Tax=Arthroderma uncinatum TaxID=74035 RepID=UPI00144A6316|nr:uncharacterized protein GIQ15_03632 [Arthroderma uncinatum]KAF3484308.1 hypothetical protein GIQ15_03632 [Arthroderma uncinatum]